ncbi:DMT family transporter [Microvirga sp. BT689]|uniref:DMT family transporter n=1 Tax=Microvirga arvi TaxID=2778731 RepID=UPI00194F9A0D|nr:DMT family transporter [Microvirga arvi]MBM6583537.1 DMT family transporter [Microvirga arvi]
MTSSVNNHTKGLAITAIGGLTLTIDIPLIRLSEGDPWSILMLRSGTTFVAAMTIWLLWKFLRGNAPALIPGRAGLMVAALYAAASVTFTMAVFNTSTANLVFILAFNTVFATLLSWLLLRERPRPVTLAAMAAMIGGVLIIVFDGIGTGNLVGDLLALASALLLATAITRTRASGKDMGFTSLVALVVPFAIAAVMVSRSGFRIDEPWWILINGALILPVSFFCLATGPKYISGPEVAMFYLLETVLAPIWVWMIFAEVPTSASLTGGAVLITTLVAHSLWQLREGRRRGSCATGDRPAYCVSD